MIFNHMDALRNDNNYTSFAIGLTKLKPILHELTNVTRVVWMQQAPIVDANNTEHYTFHSFLAKVHRYNAGMREILAYVIHIYNLHFFKIVDRNIVGGI